MTTIVMSCKGQQSHLVQTTNNSMHRLPSFIEILIPKASVTTPPLYIPKSKETEIVVTLVSFGKTCISI